MKRALALAVALAALAANGQILSGGRAGGSSGGAGTADGGTALTIGDVTTTAVVQLYVDPAGSDSNLCTAAGSSACLTPTGAAKKIPPRVRHNATVTIAAGSYPGLTVSGFVIDMSLQSSVGILFDAALANVTPTTGPATGTATSAVVGTAPVFGTLTDSTQTWTVNDSAMVGKFITITGGTGAGQIKPIVSNTATAITIAGIWAPVPTSSSTYAIQAPGVHFTTAAPAIANPLGLTTAQPAGIQIYGNVAVAGRISFRNIDVAVTGGTTNEIFVTGSGAVDFTNMTATSTSAVGLNVQIANNVQWTNSVITSTSGIGIGVLGGTATVVGSLFSQTTGNSVLSTSNGSHVSVTNSQLKGLLGVVAQTGGTGLISGSRCDCNSQANSACVVAGSTPASLASGIAPQKSGAVTFSGSDDVTNCSFGIFANGPSYVGGTSGSGVLSGNALTNAVDARNGASVILPTSVATITGATAALSVDNGAVADTLASLTASNNCLVNLATGSRICRQ